MSNSFGRVSQRPKNLRPSLLAAKKHYAAMLSWIYYPLFFILAWLTWSKLQFHIWFICKIILGQPSMNQSHSYISPMSQRYRDCGHKRMQLLKILRHKINISSQQKLLQAILRVYSNNLGKRCLSSQRDQFCLNSTIVERFMTASSCII